MRKNIILYAIIPLLLLLVLFVWFFFIKELNHKEIQEAKQFRLPDERVFRSDILRPYMQSTKEVEPGHYLFADQGNFSMHLPKDASSLSILEYEPYHLKEYELNIPYHYYDWYYKLKLYFHSLDELSNRPLTKESNVIASDVIKGANEETTIHYKVMKWRAAGDEEPPFDYTITGYIEREGVDKGIDFTIEHIAGGKELFDSLETVEGILDEALYLLRTITLDNND